MISTNISLWGLSLLVLLTGAVIALFCFIDRKMMKLLGRVTLYAALSMAVVAGYMWGLFRLDSWWSLLLWTVVLSGGMTFLILWKKKEEKVLRLPVLLAVFAGFLLTILVAALLQPDHQPLYLPAVLAVQAAFMYPAVTAGLNGFINSMRHTQPHYQYLLANGATHIEAIRPSLRRGLRATLVTVLSRWTSPMVFAVPMVLCGLLMTGVPPLLATLVVVLLMILVLCVCVVTMVLTFLFADRYLFDPTGKFLI